MLLAGLGAGVGLGLGIGALVGVGMMMMMMSILAMGLGMVMGAIGGLLLLSRMSLQLFSCSELQSLSLERKPPNYIVQWVVIGAGIVIISVYWGEGMRMLGLGS